MEFQVRVQPRAKRNAIGVVEGPGLRIYVTAPPEDGRANEAVVALVSRSLGISRSRVSIVRGHGGRDKVLRVDGLTMDDVLSRLAGK